MSAYLGARWEITGHWTIASGFDGMTAPVFIGVHREPPMTQAELVELVDRLNAGQHPPAEPKKVKPSIGDFARTAITSPRTLIDYVVISLDAHLRARRGK